MDFISKFWALSQNFEKRLLVSSRVCVRRSIRVKHAAAIAIILIKFDI
jgi:hypothetical protein